MPEPCTSAKFGRDPGRLPVLDGFRGLAILWVTLYRFGEIGWTKEVVGSALSQAVLLGAMGVDLFFVLSGFLITGVLLKAREDCDRYFLKFYWRRSLRIFPLYFGSLFLFLWLLPVGLGNRAVLETVAGNPWHLWFYTMNWEIAWRNEWCFGALNHFWSLAIEEQYYLIWPWIVYLLGPRSLQRLCVTLVVVLALGRIGYSWAELGSVSEKTYTFFRLDGLLLGSWAQLWTRQFDGWRACVGAYRWAMAGLAVLFVSSLFFGANDLTIRYTLVSALATATLLVVLADEAGAWESRWLDSAVLRSLGKYSYAMYVFQMPLIPLLAPWLSVERLQGWVVLPLLAGTLYVAILFAVTYAAAWISWHVWERWFLQARDLFFVADRCGPGARCSAGFGTGFRRSVAEDASQAGSAGDR